MFERPFQVRHFCWLAVVAVFVFSIRDACCQAEPTVSFVAGFDRFSRHGEVDSRLGGRVLLSELSCAACHLAGPEIQPKRGPNLDGVGNRVSHEWLARFLNEPQTVKPGTTMPDMLAGLSDEERPKATAALVAFLTTQRKPFPDIKGTGLRPVPLEFWNRGQLTRGRQLYHQIGCVACHAADESYETVETKPTPLDELLKELNLEELEALGLSSAARRVESVPHGDLAAKYSRQSLTFFLIDPHSVRPGGRMPNFQLTVDEASDLTAWLLRDQKLPPPGHPAIDASQPEPRLVAEGKRLFRELGCANCHTVPGIEPAVTAKPTSELNWKAARNCLGPPVKGLPHFSLDEKQTAAIEAGALGTGLDVFARVADPASHVQLHLLKLNCLACHERDKLGGVGRYRRAFFETYGHIDIGDEGRLPPPLTKVGRKLLPAWTANVLKGSGAVRPHMRIRMPVFPADEVSLLPALLTQADFGQDGKLSTERDVFGDQSNLAEAGRALLDTGCVQCHPLRGEALPGVVGVDLAGIASRVQPKWFHDFLLDPAELKSRTRMPTFFPGGKSQNAAILEGDTERQIAAMWAYLKDLNRQKLPSKIEKARSENYELIPQDRPIILRTFMEEAGTHAVAVGFPQKVHFAFDAEAIRPAFAWRGRFLDARGTWFERFTPPANPLGGDGIAFPAGVALAEPKTAEALWPVPPDVPGYRYLGHRIDKNGVPTFRYLVGEFLIEDRITPRGKGLRRELTITDRTDGNPRSLQFLVHAGSELKWDGASSTDATGLKVTVPAQYADKGRVVKRDGYSERQLSIPVDRKKKLEVQYEW